MFIIFVAGILYLNEDFNTLKKESENRHNPLASLANPLQNPAAPIGLSVSEAATLRKVTAAALTPVESFAGTNASWALLN